jgi:hypothetical protein
MKVSNECANLRVNGLGTTINININLRDALGSMYDKYTKFKIVLNSVGITSSINGFSGGNSIPCSIRLSGLNFINNMSGSYGFFPSVFQPNTNLVTIQNFITNDGLCFVKSSTPQINLTFDIYNNFTSSILVTVGVGYFMPVLSFSIYGLYDD